MHLQAYNPACLFLLGLNFSFTIIPLPLWALYTRTTLQKARFIQPLGSHQTKSPNFRAPVACCVALLLLAEPRAKTCRKPGYCTPVSKWGTATAGKPGWLSKGLLVFWVKRERPEALQSPQ